MGQALYKSINIPIEYYIVALLIMFITGFIQFYKKRNIAVSFAWAFLIGYLFLIFSTTVFVRTAKTQYRYNLRPFWSYAAIVGGNVELLSLNVANILMLMPVGFFAACIGGMSGKRAVRMGFVVSGTIEFFQLILKRGLFEFDDIFHNTVGCIVGYLIYRLYNGIREKM